MKKLTSATLILAVALLASACIIVSDSDSSLTVDNQSDYILYEIHVTDVGSPTWGPDLLGGDILYPGESLTIYVDCGTYDALVVDEDGVQCELYGLDLCFDDAVWVIDNFELNTCGF